MKARVKLAQEQGLLKGDLNILQDSALQSLLLEEGENKSNLEEERVKFMILANNPELYKALFLDRESEEENIEWLGPHSAEDVEDILADYARVQRESVDISSSTPSQEFSEKST